MTLQLPRNWKVTLEPEDQCDAEDHVWDSEYWSVREAGGGPWIAWFPVRATCMVCGLGIGRIEASEHSLREAAMAYASSLRDNPALLPSAGLFAFDIQTSC